MKDKDFIKQTAKDYSLSYHIVETMFYKYPDSLYKRLEEELKERERKNGKEI